jgi:hypothetical protein
MTAKTGEDLHAVFKKAKQSVRDKAKASGSPLYYLRNGKRIREDVDGSKHVLVIDSDGKLSEYNFE